MDEYEISVIQMHTESHFKRRIFFKKINFYLLNIFFFIQESPSETRKKNTKNKDHKPLLQNYSCYSFNVYFVVWLCESVTLWMAKQCFAQPSQGYVIPIGKYIYVIYLSSTCKNKNPLLFSSSSSSSSLLTTKWNNICSAERCSNPKMDWQIATNVSLSLSLFLWFFRFISKLYRK